MIAALADARRATGGVCCICGATATQWHRSGRRDTNADGLTLAVRCCGDHETAALAAMRLLTIADVASLTPRSRRSARAAGAITRANRMTRRAAASRRAAAALSGASSATHSYALIGGLQNLEAAALRRLAAHIVGVSTDEIPRAVISNGGP